MVLDLDEIRAKTEAATPGPWELLNEDDRDPDELLLCSHVEQAMIVDTDCGVVYAADASFIAGAREWVPALVAEVERLRAAAETLHWFYLMVKSGGPDGSDLDYAVWEDAEKGAEIIAEYDTFPDPPVLGESRG